VQQVVASSIVHWYRQIWGQLREVFLPCCDARNGKHRRRFEPRPSSHIFVHQASGSFRGMCFIADVKGKQ
jgi:hypothetical protein